MPTNPNLNLCLSAMDSLNRKKMNPADYSFTKSSKPSGETNLDQSCINPCCFFCIMKEPYTKIRRAGIAKCFNEMCLRDEHDQVLVLSGMWHIAMTHPDDPEFPSLGIFHAMATLINKAIKNRNWLLRDQNIYIPYYAAHIIGSYTMNKVEFAEKAVSEGVISPLIELLRGKISWVEQRVAVRALGHLASYEKTFEAVAVHQEEVVTLAMQIASNSLEVVYETLVGVRDEKRRPTYHCDLLTRGVGGIDMENRKAEEWGSQLQCWSLYLLNCFACKERSLARICNREFLKDLCHMWGGLVNHSSPSGVGLIRILCYSRVGRKAIAESREVIRSLCNLSRSSDDWQYMGIDCLLLLLNDSDTRYKVIEFASLFLIDLIELKTLVSKSNIGEAITRSLLSDYKLMKAKLEDTTLKKTLQQIWHLKVVRKKREENMSDEKLQERRVLATLMKQEGNHAFSLGEIEEAVIKYTEALELCPLKFRKERMILYSNRSQCHLLLKDSDSAIKDSTRALSLANPANSHRRSLWRRSQAYDVKGLAKESLMDCLMFVNGCIKSESTTNTRVKIPYYAARMISKQMDATWIFASARLKSTCVHVNKVQHESDGGHESSNDEQQYDDMMRMMMMENKAFTSGLSTNLEEAFILKGTRKEKQESARKRK